MDIREEPGRFAIMKAKGVSRKERFKAPTSQKRQIRRNKKCSLDKKTSL